MAAKGPGRSRRKKKAEEELWEERDKRLEELLEKDGENPKAKEDFNRLLEEMARSSE